MLRTIDRFNDDELPIDETPAARVRAFFHQWADELGARRDG